MKILIKSGHVVDPMAGFDGKFDVLIDSGKIADIKEMINVTADKVIDAAGKLVLPGLIDAHCHLRDPGFEYKEDIETGTKSAALGGFTSIACMPNTNPVIDNQTVLSYIINKSRNKGAVNVFPIGAISKGLKGEELAEIGDMQLAGAVAISDDGKPVSSSSLMKKALQYAAIFNMPVISHCEDDELADEGLMNEGYTSTVLGLKGIPSAAEEVMVSRELILAEYTNTPVHIAHVSTELSVELIRNAKKRGVKVTAETCPHYFTLTDEACEGFNTLAKVNPPLRGNNDLEAIIEGLADGTIDIIATDHAPHHKDEKNVEFKQASNGLVGFETALALGITKLVNTDRLSMQELVKKMSLNPADLLNLNKGSNLKGSISKGFDGDIIVVDIENEFEVDINKFASKSKNSPFNGMKLKGKVCCTIVGGKIIVEDGELQCS